MFGLLLAIADATLAGNWPGFRGNGTSLTATENLPLKWSETENVTWSIDVPGYGQSSPVVWGGAVFVTSVEGEMKETLLITRLDADTGKIAWTQRLPASQKIKMSEYVSRAAPTPVVTADRLFVFFESGDLLAFDHAGQQKWKRSLSTEYGEFQGNHGVGSSLALADNRLIVLVDHSGPSYLLAIDGASGETHWKVDREPRVSWSTPLVVTDADRPAQILISSNGVAEAYAVSDGSRLWWLDGLEKNTVASPTATNELVVIGSSTTKFNMAIRRNGTGKLDESSIVWRAENASSSFGSPLIHNDCVYFVNRAGVAFCLDLATGAEHWSHRIAASCWASPVGAGDRVYFFGNDGTTTVVQAGTEYEELARNTLPADDRVSGVAIQDGAFLIRAGTRLTKVTRSAP